MSDVPSPDPVRTDYENELRETIARCLYEHHNRNLKDVWRWRQDGLEAEHPGTVERYERQADALLAGPLSQLQADLRAAREERDALSLIVMADDAKAVAEYEWERANKLAAEASKLRSDLAAAREEIAAVERALEGVEETARANAAEAELARLRVQLQGSAMDHIARDLSDDLQDAEVSKLRERVATLEAMQTELRPFSSGEDEGLDEIVIQGSTLVHAETMSDTALWIGISDETGGLVHVWINAIRRKGKMTLVMTASDEGERGTIGMDPALSPLQTEKQP